MQRLKIIFAGTPVFAAEHLRTLLDQSRHQVVAVYTQPDRPAGRGKKLSPSAVKALALKEDIPVYQPRSLRDAVSQQQMAGLNADIMVVVAYGLILPKAVLAMPSLGCINVHASLLPRWRGAAPIQRAIEAGDQQSGITIMEMDEGLDTGPMLSRVSCSISETDTSASLQDKLAITGADALLRTLDAIAEPGSQRVAERQDEALATYAHKITKQEARVDWHQSARVLDCRIRAFYPVPIAFTSLGSDTLRIWRAKAVTYSHQAAAGTIMSCDRKGILVACHNDALLLTDVQLPGKRHMAVSDLLQGRTAMFAPGTQLGT